MDFTSLMPNQSPEPTAVGAVSSAVAVHATSRRWFSFFSLATRPMTKKIILGIAHAALIIEIVIVCNYQHDVLAPGEPIWPGVIGSSIIALAFMGAVRGLEA